MGFAALGGCAALDAPDPATSDKSVDSKASAQTSPLATGSWRSFSWILSDKNSKEPLVLVEQSLPSNQEEAVCANDQAGLHGMLRPLPGRKLMLCASERLQPQSSVNAEHVRSDRLVQVGHDVALKKDGPQERTKMQTSTSKTLWVQGERSQQSPICASLTWPAD